MNILLIRPRPSPETIGLQHVMICEPLELEYLAASIAYQDHQVDILDMILETRPLPDLLTEFQPNLVAMTGYITHPSYQDNGGYRQGMVSKLPHCSGRGSCRGRARGFSASYPGCHYLRQRPDHLSRADTLCCNRSVWPIWTVFSGAAWGLAS